MTLSDVATVSGKGGLFKVLAPTKSGVILESMDEAKTKMIATTNHKLSLLNEISIYTTTKEGTVALQQVLKKIHDEYGNDLGIDANAETSELKSFLKSVLPDFDENRVYASDIKKLVKWYDILLKYAPDVITAEPEKSEKDQDVKTEEKKSDEAVKEKPASAKVKAEEKSSAKEKAPAKKSSGEKKSAEKKSEPKATKKGK